MAMDEGRIARFREQLQERGLAADRVPEGALGELLGTLDRANGDRSEGSLTDQDIASMVAHTACSRWNDPIRWVSGRSTRPDRVCASTVKVDGTIHVRFAGQTNVLILPGL